MRKLTKQDFWKTVKVTNDNFYIDIVNHGGGAYKVLAVMRECSDQTIGRDSVDEILFNITTGKRNKISNKIASMFGFHLDNEDVMTPEDVLTAYHHYHNNNGRPQKNDSLFIDVDNDYIIIRDNRGYVESVVMDLRDMYRRNISAISESYFDFEVCNNEIGDCVLSYKDSVELLCQVIQYQNGTLE